MTFAGAEGHHDHIEEEPGDDEHSTADGRRHNDVQPHGGLLGLWGGGLGRVFVVLFNIS